ncbi:SUMF1/EgtB/PvdO family nonheme iron enzyme [Cupriavidus sp. UME77]|uniref:formylglycine-generating enzyme family protein n=1 Tax=Cupriavidus sp. UME77 TaxID=1862321 RepID=UPI00160160C1|nr:SUMF1/EgtB/PvdO family nonheme iron enzyme [Cupriavidus sp. UME77]MBB1631587.1 hypothetical protein [Cupriavidus sp. UME77]
MKSPIIARAAVALLSFVVIGTQLRASELPGVLPPRQPHLFKVKEADHIKGPPPLSQPQALRDELTALAEGSIDDRVAKLKRKVLKDLVFVEGGTFMMGDFGPWWSPEKLYYTSGFDNKPPYRVTLTGYNIARYKATYAEFDVFADATGQPRAGMEWREGRYRHPLVPVGAHWQRAKDYCVWLARETGVPFDLPTEAQWEYAARSRGQNFLWATDNGNIEIGRNVPSYAQQHYFLRPVIHTAPNGRNVLRAAGEPVGIFPPNPLGLYDMNANGWEWMQDWYDANWYRASPGRDPKGPPTGTLRSLRGYAEGDYISGLNVLRYSADPMLVNNRMTGEGGPGLAAAHSVRCVANQDHPVEVER